MKLPESNFGNVKVFRLFWQPSGNLFPLEKFREKHPREINSVEVTRDENDAAWSRKIITRAHRIGSVILEANAGRARTLFLKIALRDHS